MRKTYIGVKCGLSRDPKHRQAMGECVWLFLHMIDIVDWETGVVSDWRDEAAAEEMGMPVRTLREQRRKLEELDYVSCEQKQYSQNITIKNWTNPREYSGDVKNKKQGDAPPPPSPQGYTQGSTQDVTPTYRSTTNKRGDLVDGYLDLMHTPGIKREARIDAILSYLGGMLKINTETARWKKFAKFVDERQRVHGERLETFVGWLLGKDDFNVLFWSALRCEEMWPQAFVKVEPQAELVY